MDYLRWYRRVLGLVVQNEHRVTDVLPRAEGWVELRIEVPGSPRRSHTAFARRLGKILDPSMVRTAVPVKNDRTDTRSLCLFSKCLADTNGTLTVRTELLFLEFFPK
mgnify:CR=1 FL=1